MNDQAFCIMQIGNPEMDRVYTEVFEPAAKACGLTAKRVDKHNVGNLLKSEIVRYLKNAVILIADITNERPNCYLEIGFAMGLGKTENLILAARQDHLPGHPKHSLSGPKIHFDLGGYDITLWDPENLELYRNQLTLKIRQRLKHIRNSPSGQSSLVDPWADAWTQKHRTKSKAGLKKANRPGSLEFTFRFDSFVRVASPLLIRAVATSNLHWFGWPVAFVGHTEEIRPKPDVDGVTAEIFSGFGSYDYWALQMDCTFTQASVITKMIGLVPPDKRFIWTPASVVSLNAFSFALLWQKQMG